jgi:hypothetical protein
VTKVWPPGSLDVNPFDYIKCGVSRRGINRSSHKIKLSLHCGKSLFVLASRQKIPLLRTENPAVDTRKICLLPIEFF